MTRKKVKLMWIVNDSARKTSLKKRRAGLLKKVSELTTLCGVNAFILIYSPDEKEPQMWPSRPVVEQLLARFNNMREMEKCKKMMNQETYLKERVGKTQDQVKKHDRKNKEMDVYQIMEQMDEGKQTGDCTVNELHGLVWFSEDRMREIRKRIEYYQQVNPCPPESLPPPPPALPPPPSPSPPPPPPPPSPPLPLPPPQLPTPVDSTAGIRGSTGGDRRNPPESGLWDQWFIDMMNNSENIAGSSSAKAKSDAGLTSYQASGASSGTANQMGLPHVNPRAYNIGPVMGMPHVNPIAYNIGSAMGMPQGNINIGRSSLFGGSDGANDGNMGQLQVNEGEASNATNRDMGLPSERFGSSIAGSDVGMPYDVTKQWPGNFYP